MDDLREFEKALKDIENLRHKAFLSSDVENFMKVMAYDLVIIKIKIAIDKWRSRHAEQNSSLSVEICDDSELPANIKKDVCGFGDEK